MVRFTTDPAWLVHQAINRRAGWPKDPGCYRGTCCPTPDGRYPKKAIGETYSTLRLLARQINTPRLIVRDCTLGEWRGLLRARIPWRIWDPADG